MQTIKINLREITQEQINLAVDYLKRGQVLAYPTDTIYGLGCDARNIAAIQKINKMKGEKGKKPLIVLISDFSMLRQYCFISLEQAKYLETVWPGPVTVILKRRPKLSAELTGGLSSMAVRLPNNGFLIRMISEAGFPVVSTSLNKKGEKPLTNIQAIEGHFKYKPDLAIDAGVINRSRPSRLVDLRDVKNTRVIRE